ncbi:phage portal protein [Erythrobacter sp. HL-111]|uniref:phage portal protein n=1 Tax=Erythrobacter sp. HL-111 TaxID=1798193 RepID=UPI0006D9F9A9|nr:phage portal protein [Erythrobacter sp. HL-111]KPP94103.1 MAG: phage portal protein, HK97 family [Erythrobacteraceae bacterium HL-111]SDS62593.1 phage portal protein, HK97 family [Erythrobacter sp. HL-111]
MALIDTLLSAFKGGERNRVPLFPGYLQGCFAGSGPVGTPRSFEYRRAVEAAYLANPIAQRAVRIVAEGVGQAPMSCSDPDLARLVKATSAGQPLVESLAAHVLLHGNGYVQILKDASGRPVELFALRPDRVSIIAGPDGWPQAFRYEVGDEGVTIPVEDEQGWPSIIQIKALHPLDDHLGAGSLAAANQAILVHNAATAWNHALLENAARPSGALVYESGDGAGLTQDQFDRLRNELESAFAGAHNAGRPLLLDGGLKWQSMALSPADMDFASLKSAAAREIALAFGVPPMLLGLPGDNTYSNYREANRALWRLTLLPLAQKLFSALEEGLEAWFPAASIAIDLDRITALSEDRERLWKQVSDADFLSRAEKRQMLGFAAEENAP